MVVEGDETFIGGKSSGQARCDTQAQNHRTGGKDKTVVVGILERGGQVRAAVVASRKKEVLQAEVRKHVEAGAALYSDALLSYRWGW